MFNVDDIGREIFKIIINISFWAAAIRLGLDGLKEILGEEEYVFKGLMKVGTGLATIFLAHTFVNYVIGFSKSIAVFKGW